MALETNILAMSADWQHTPVSAGFQSCEPSNRISLLQEHPKSSSSRTAHLEETHTQLSPDSWGPVCSPASCGMLELPVQTRSSQMSMTPETSRATTTLPEPVGPLLKPPRAAHLVSTGLYDVSPFQKSCVIRPWLPITISLLAIINAVSGT